MIIDQQAVTDNETRVRDNRWFEDYPVGLTAEHGAVTMTEADIVEFARQYDPQPFHVDPVGAGHGPFAGLIASGWHTAAVMMRLYADHFLSHTASLGGPAVDELRWEKPVRPGDTLRLGVQVLEARPSSTRPERGILRAAVTMKNQQQDIVFRCVVTNFLLRRPEPGSAAGDVTN